MMERPMKHQSAPSASVLPFALVRLCSQNLIWQLFILVLERAKLEDLKKIYTKYLYFLKNPTDLKIKSLNLRTKQIYIITDMAEINRLKVVLVEKKRTGKWLAEELDKDVATVSKWCTNTAQPSLETLLAIANLLDMNIQDLLIPTNLHKYDH